jgi:hypothetical protein
MDKNVGYSDWEDQVQDQENPGQERAQRRDKPEDAALVTQLSLARDKAVHLEKEIEEKNQNIARLEEQVQDAEGRRLAAIGGQQFSQAEGFRRQYEELSQVCEQLRREKRELQEQHNRSEAEIVRLKRELQLHEEELHFMAERVKLRDEQLEHVRNAGNMSDEARRAPFAADKGNQLGTEQDAPTAEEQRDEQPPGVPEEIPLREPAMAPVREPPRSWKSPERTGRAPVTRQISITHQGPSYSARMHHGLLYFA